MFRNCFLILFAVMALGVMIEVGSTCKTSSADPGPVKLVPAKPAVTVAVGASRESDEKQSRYETPILATRSDYDDLRARVEVLERLQKFCKCGEKSVLLNAPPTRAEARQAGRTVRQCLNGVCGEYTVFDDGTQTAVTCTPANAAACQVQYGDACQVQTYQSSGNYRSGIFGGGGIFRGRCRGCN